VCVCLCVTYCWLRVRVRVSGSFCVVTYWTSLTAELTSTTTNPRSPACWVRVSMRVCVSVCVSHTGLVRRQDSRRRQQTPAHPPAAATAPRMDSEMCGNSWHRANASAQSHVTSLPSPSPAHVSTRTPATPVLTNGLIQRTVNTGSR